MYYHLHPLSSSLSSSHLIVSLLKVYYISLSGSPIRALSPKRNVLSLLPPCRLDFSLLPFNQYSVRSILPAIPIPWTDLSGTQPIAHPRIANTNHCRSMRKAGPPLVYPSNSTSRMGLTGTSGPRMRKATDYLSAHQSRQQRIKYEYMMSTALTTATRST